MPGAAGQGGNLGGSSGSSSSSGGSQAAAHGAAGEPQYAPASLAPGRAPQQQAGAEQPAAVDPEGNVLDGNTEAAAYPDDDEEPGSTAGSSDQGGASAAAAGADKGDAPIKSPWAAVGGMLWTSLACDPAGALSMHATRPAVNRCGYNSAAQRSQLRAFHSSLPVCASHCRRLRHWMRRRPAGRRPAASWRRSWPRCTTQTCWCWQVGGVAWHVQVWWAAGVVWLKGSFCSPNQTCCGWQASLPSPCLMKTGGMPWYATLLLPSNAELLSALHSTPQPVPCHLAVPPAADEATGQARQVVADEHYLIPNETLGQAYRRCAHVRLGCRGSRSGSLSAAAPLLVGLLLPLTGAFLKCMASNFIPCTRPAWASTPPLAQAGHTRREKRKPYKHLRTPWGETFTFSTDSRQVGAVAAPAQASFKLAGIARGTL